MKIVNNVLIIGDFLLYKYLTINYLQVILKIIQKNISTSDYFFAKA